LNIVKVENFLNTRNSEMHSELSSLLFLQSIPGMGSVLLHRLWRRYGSFATVCEASVSDLQLVSGIGKNLTLAVKQVIPNSFREQAEMLLKAEASVCMISDSERYPFRLLEVPNAPPLLFQMGSASLNSNRVIGIVGTRQATSRGLSFTRQLIEELVPYNPLIVSGLALGIDGAAHAAALECGLKTAAVLGSGLDVCYPPEHEGLQREIGKRGALISELLPGVVPERAYFPMRNRIVAGLCDAIVLIEAADKGGALLTCAHANRYKRPVFALPGRTEDPWSQGPLQLLARQEARIFYKTEHIVDALHWLPERKVELNAAVQSLPLPDEDEAAALVLLQQHGDLHVNDWAEKLGLPVSQMSNLILTLELKSFIVRLPGNRFSTLVKVI
jgi:DNA processing protein